MNLAPAHGLCLLYRRKGEQPYLDLARQLVGEFAAADADGKPMAGDYLRRGLAGEPFYATPKPRWESLHPILALAELYRITGEVRYRTAFENLWWSIVEFDRHNNGGFSSGEQAQGNPYHRGAIETCCTIAWMAMSVEMLAMTGDPIVADELELSTLNSAMGMWSPSGRWSTYNTPMDGVRKANFHEISFQCRPGSPELNCCSVNAARGLGLIGEWAVMRDAGRALPQLVRARHRSPRRWSRAARSSWSRRRLSERRGPCGSASSRRSRGQFALRLRIPHWSARTSAKVNGEPVAGIVPGRYLALSRAWKPGDMIELELDMTPRFWAGERECAGLTSIYRGPILMTYDRRFNAIDAADLPTLDATNLSGGPPAERVGPMPPMLLIEYPAAGGRSVRLCDFASAGADGSAYQSWLKVEHIPASPFRRTEPAPERAGRREVGSIRTWHVKYLISYIGGMAVSPDREPDVVGAISHPARRRMLDLLIEADRSVNTIAGHFPMSRPAVSHHPCIPLDAGLVTEQRHGRERRYRLVPARLGPVRDWIAHYEWFWDDYLQRLQRHPMKGDEK